jgi:hypothetical protein
MPDRVGEIVERTTHKVSYAGLLERLKGAQSLH